VTNKPCTDRRVAKRDRIARYRIARLYAEPRRRAGHVHAALLAASRSTGPALANAERVAVQWPFDGEDIYA
jgi:hypothetical protein